MVIETKNPHHFSDVASLLSWSLHNEEGNDWLPAIKYILTRPTNKSRKSIPHRC